MWPDFNIIEDPDVPTRDKVSYLQYMKHGGKILELDANSRKELSNSITKQLDSPYTRYEGLLTWRTAITTSNLYISNWGNLLEASLALSNSSESKRAAVDILIAMIYNFKYEAQLQASFLQYWPTICKCLTEHCRTNEDVLNMFRSLKALMEFIPALVAHNYAAILDLILKHLDSESLDVTEALSVCFSLLPRLVKEKFTPQSIWAGLFEKGTNSLQLQIKDIVIFYTGPNGTRNEMKPDDYLQIPPCSSTQGMPVLLHKVRVFISLSKCLVKLMCSLSHKVEVRPESLLEVIKQVIYLNDRVTLSGTPFLQIYYPVICKSSLQLLEAIILCFPLEIYIQTICAIIEKLLTSEQINNEPLFNREIRLATWKFLLAWTGGHGPSVAYKLLSDNIVGELICDISIASEHTVSDTPTVDTQICLIALKVLGNLIQNATALIEKATWEIIIDGVQNLARRVQSQMRSLRTPNQPYCREDCRITLYNVLLDCCIYSHPLREKCVRSSIYIFTAALKDPNIEIKSLARRASNLIKNFLNPKKHPPDCEMPVAPVVQNDTHYLAPWQQMPAPEPVPFEAHWQEDHLNGGIQPMEVQQGPPPMYEVGEIYSLPPGDGENTQERPSDRETPHYAELQPAGQYNNLKASPRTSSRSESLDNSIEDDIIEDEEENEHSQHSRFSDKHQASSVPEPNSSRPNIQVLTVQSGESIVEDVHSDQEDSMEEGEVPRPKSFVPENGTLEDSEEEDEAYDEDEAEEEEYEEQEPNEERFSPEPEDRPNKKIKADNDDINREEDVVSSEEEETNKNAAEAEEIMEDQEDEKNQPEVKPEVNGQTSASPSHSENDPTVDEMISDLVVAEADPDS